MSDVCMCCGGVIEIHEFDCLTAFYECVPITFNKGNFHLECYKLAFEDAKYEVSSNTSLYNNRLDEYGIQTLYKIIKAETIVDFKLFLLVPFFYIHSLNWAILGTICLVFNIIGLNLHYVFKQYKRLN